jgi:hypothetical protein
MSFTMDEAWGGEGGLTAAENAELDRIGAPRNTATSADWTIDGMSADLYNQRNPVAPPVPTTPPVDYGRLIAGIGSAVGGVFQGINTAIQNSQTNRLRELELQYANERGAATLALQRLAIENQNAIAQLNGSASPAAAQTQQALQQQNADLSARLAAGNQQQQDGMSTGTTVALVVGGVAVLGGIAYLALKK